MIRHFLQRSPLHFACSWPILTMVFLCSHRAGRSVLQMIVQDARVEEPCAIAPSRLDSISRSREIRAISEGLERGMGALLRDSYPVRQMCCSASLQR